MKRNVLILFLVWVFFPVMQKAVADKRDFPVCLEKAGGRTVDSGEGMKKELDRLLRDLERLQKEAEKKMRQDVLPDLRKEIERLRKWLRDFEFREKKREPDRTWT
jgi:hypothetical protein